MLEVKNITKTYHGKRGVEELSFSLNSSEILGVVGCNGSGKTTTFRLLLQLLHPDSGEILVDGQPLEETDKCLFGYLPEERSVYRDLRVCEQLQLMGKLKGMDEKLIEERIDYWLNRLDISQYYDSYIQQLSKGNQQKVQLICALLHDPKIVILDEPLTGLDIINAQLFKEIVNELSASGKIILLSSHQFENVEEFFEKILLLKEGKCVWFGNVDQLRKSSQNRYIHFYTNKVKDYYLEEGVLHQSQSGKMMSLLMEDEQSAKKLFRKLLKEPLLSLTLELPTIKDIIQERGLL